MSNSSFLKESPLDVFSDEAIRQDEESRAGEFIAAELDHPAAEHGNKAFEHFLVGF